MVYLSKILAKIDILALVICILMNITNMITLITVYCRYIKVRFVS